MFFQDVYLSPSASTCASAELDLGLTMEEVPDEEFRSLDAAYKVF